MSQRIFGVLLLALCIGLGAIAWGYHAPFSYEPVGPRAYPLLLLILLGLGGICLLLKPNENSPSEEEPFNRHVLLKVAGCVLTLLLYAAFFQSLGFIVASILFSIAMSRLYDGSWPASLIGSVVMTLGLYLLFDKVLDVSLPAGILSALENQ